MNAEREMATKNRLGRKQEVGAGRGALRPRSLLGWGRQTRARTPRCDGHRVAGAGAYAASVGVARRFFQSQYHAIQMQIS